MLFGGLIIAGIVIMILHLDSLGYSVYGRSFEDVAPLIYLPLIILFFVMMLVGTYRRGKK